MSKQRLIKQIIVIALACFGAAESSDAAQITQAEYFIGSDPGAGSGTALALAGTETLGSGFQQLSLGLSGRAPGTYTVGIRVLDDQGRWSNPALRRFTIHGAEIVAETTDLVQEETTTDPEPPLATEWSVSLPPLSGDSVSLSAGGFPLSFTREDGETDEAFFARIRASLAGDAYISSRFTVGPVSDGSFTLSAKTAGPSTDFPLDSEELQVTRVTDGTLGASGRKITVAEYFWDLDPGMGEGVVIPMSTNGNDASTSTQSLSLANLTGGNHRLGVRFKNAAGRWSNPVYRGLSSFVLFGESDLAPPSLALVGDSRLTLTQGAVFSDPGATASDEVDGNLLAKVVVTISVDPTRAGIQTMEYAVVDRAGNIARIQREVEVIAADPNGDLNSNGLPDSWEQQYTFDETPTATGDPDGDGTSNFMEYLAGTDPKDGSSVFRPSGSLAGMVYTLPIPTVADRVYEVWVSRDLNNWELRQPLSGDGSVQNFIFDETTITSGPLLAPSHPSRFFFRVEVAVP